MNRTIAPKRGRRRYLEVQQRVRCIVARREEQERTFRHEATVMATSMSLIREVLGLPTPEDEKQYIDPSILQYTSLNRDYVEKALKYLNSDFTPAELYKLTAGGIGWQRGIVDWLVIRHSIVEVLDGERSWGVIPSSYYGFPNNECFYFDETVENPNGVNHTSWRKVKKPVAKKVEQASSELKLPVRSSWWKRWVECCRC